MSAQLSQLSIANIRNLAAQDITFGAEFNLITGANGSGKTSLLEAIYLLSVGRSFRARSMQQIIAFGAQQLLIRAKVSISSTEYAGDMWLALERDLHGQSNYRIGEQAEKSVSELTKLLPVQLIDVESHLLLEGGPIYRRQFLDWGVFHVEQNFLSQWRLMQRALQQRNASLRQQQSTAQWDEVFINYALQVDIARAAYVERFRAAFNELLLELLGWDMVTVQYKRGWAVDTSLANALALSYGLDSANGYTSKGPQRADLEVLFKGRPAKEVLSRGQTKILVCIMLLTRAKLLSNNKLNVFLIDDLHAELDKKSCELFIEAIAEMRGQVLITGIEADLLKQRLHGRNSKLFHVEQGCVAEM